MGDAADGLEALRDFVGGLLDFLVGLLEELVDAEVLGTFDVPVVLVELVVEDVRVREVGVQRFDNLLGFLGVESNRVVADAACFLED